MTSFVPSRQRVFEDRIVRRVKRVEERLDARQHPQLPNSAVDDGAVTVTVGGGIAGYFGKQYDGTNGYVAVNGPVPPQPGPPLVETVVGGIRVTVTGALEDPGAVVPLDFARYDVEVSTSPAFGEFAAVPYHNSGSVLPAGGGAVKVAWPDAGTTVYVRVRMRATTGQVSPPSDVVGPVATGSVGLGDLGFELANYVASDTILYSTTQPAPPSTIGTLWVKEIISAGRVAHETYRWNGATWDRLQDQGVTDSLLAAAAAQAAADSKAKVYYAASAPAHTGAAGSGYWFDSDDGNRPYVWSGTAWGDLRLGNAAITPNSLVASNVIATGTVSAALLEAIMVLATAVIAGDPAGEYTRIDGTGVRAFATDTDGLPVELGQFGRSVAIRNPVTGQVVGGIDEDGEINGTGLTIRDPDPEFGGTLLSELLWGLSWGIVAWGRYTGTGINPATTNTELAFLELAFAAKAGRMYSINVEGIEPYSMTTTGPGVLRIRHTTNGATPTTASTLYRQISHDTMDTAWNDAFPIVSIYPGPDADANDLYVRLLFSYASAGGGQGTTINRGKDIFAFVRDEGPLINETGDELASGATGGGTTTKTNYQYEATASWVRTWNQGGSVIYDDEMHQGYGDSFNGIRKSNAGWTSLPSMTGATITGFWVMLESYHWWNMSGGTAYMSRHTTAAEPASFQTGADVIQTAFTARSQTKWISVLGNANWKASLAANQWKGIGLYAPNTSATYYGKFRGPANARPRVRIYYSK